MTNKISSGGTRRHFLGTAVGVALAYATGAPVMTSALAAPAKYRRVNVVGPNGGKALKGYAAAVKAMLALPADDPRNWYRHALTHLLDCPHGNWWFLVWHRGFLGHFEQICRELSGDPDFAIPYWDWTETPRIPDSMFDGVLTPGDPAYLNSKAEFDATISGAMKSADYWSGTGTNGEFDPRSRFSQLLGRGIRLYDDLNFDIFEDPRLVFDSSKKGLFFDRDHARGLTQDDPNLDYLTTAAVSAPTVLNALAPKDFLTFGSPKALSHSELSGFGILEGQPHNRVHNNVGGDVWVEVDGQPKLKSQRGGFMHEFLSPVDPLFYLHHANIDRLWDVWTRKQQAYGYPILPDGYLSPNALDKSAPRTDYKTWGSEEFVFFVGPDKKPVTSVAANYQSVSAFGYEYEPGFGETVVPTATAAAASQLQRRAIRRFSVDTRPRRAVGHAVRIPASLLSVPKGGRGPNLFAKITVVLPRQAHVGAYTVGINVPEGVSATGPGSPHHAGILTLFGHHTARGPITFVVPINAAVTNLRSVGVLNVGGKSQSLSFRVMHVMGGEPTHEHAPDVEIVSVVVEAH